MATIGLRDVYYALLKEDPISGSPTYDSPVKIAGAISANVNPNASSSTLFADDGPYDTSATIGEISLELNMADLSLETQSVLLGHSISDGVLKRKAGDVPPWVAIGFRTLKSNGKYRYVWLYKGKFVDPEDNNETKGDGINFQTDTITGNFLKLNYGIKVSNEVRYPWKYEIDAEDEAVKPATITNWFTSVVMPVADAGGGG